jgi:single-strand DNA-binding protein
MAGSYNKVLLMGNLTRDPELRHTPSNMAVANIGLAVNRRYRTGEGEQREETTFVDCDVFGRTAEVMCQYLKKGSPVFVEGRLRLDEWNDKTSGDKRTKLKVVVENFQFLDSKQDGSPGGGPGGSRRGAPAARAGSAAPSDSGSNYAPMGEDDIPF